MAWAFYYPFVYAPLGNIALACRGMRNATRCHKAWFKRCVACVGIFQGRNDEAIPLNERSLGILEQSCGPEHPDVGGALSQKALLLDAQVSVQGSMETA